MTLLPKRFLLKKIHFCFYFNLKGRKAEISNVHSIPKPGAGVQLGSSTRAWGSQYLAPPPRMHVNRILLNRGILIWDLGNLSAEPNSCPVSLLLKQVDTEELQARKKKTQKTSGMFAMKYLLYINLSLLLKWWGLDSMFTCKRTRFNQSVQLGC